MVQQVRDPAFFLQEPGLLLWWGFDPWTWNFHIPWAWPRDKKREGDRDTWRGHNKSELELPGTPRGMILRLLSRQNRSESETRMAGKGHRAQDQKFRR